MKSPAAVTVSHDTETTLAAEIRAKHKAALEAKVAEVNRQHEARVQDMIAAEVAKAAEKKRRDDARAAILEYAANFGFTTRKDFLELARFAPADVGEKPAGGKSVKSAKRGISDEQGKKIVALAANHSIPEIAIETGLSYNTVAKHLSFVGVEPAKRRGKGKEVNAGVQPPITSAGPDSSSKPGAIEADHVAKKDFSDGIGKPEIGTDEPDELPFGAPSEGV